MESRAQIAAGLADRWTATPPPLLPDSERYRTGLGLAGMLATGLVVAAGLLTLKPLLVIAGLLALPVIGLVCRRPFWGILGFLTVLYIRPELVSEPLANLRLPILISTLTLVAWAVQVALKKETFRWRGETGWMLAFTVVLILSTYRMPHMSDTVVGVNDTARLLCVFVLLQQLVNDRWRAHVAIGTFVALTIGLSAISVWGFFHGKVLMEHGMPRAVVPGGGFDDPNDLSAVLVLAVPLCLLYGSSSRAAIPRLLAAAALALLVLNIYLTNSRGGMIALAASAGVFTFYSAGWRKGLLLCAAGLAALVFFGPERFSTHSLVGDDSTLGRILAWKHGLRMFESSPLIGVGYGEFPRLHGMTAHNSFVLALAEGGLPAAFLWVGLNYWAILTLVRLYRRHRETAAVSDVGLWRGYPLALAAAIVGSLAAQMFLSHTYRTVPLVPLAFASALGAIDDTEGRSASADWIHYFLILVITVGAVLFLYLSVGAPQ